VTFIEVMTVVVILGPLAAVMIPSFVGVRDDAVDAGAESLLRTAASAVESASVDAGYGGVSTTALEQIEPNIEWLDADGALAASDQVSVTGLGPDGFTLSAAIPDGTVFTYVKDTQAMPVVTRACGAGCSW
jgi:type II secretory pathway pseudopilin PulG